VKACDSAIARVHRIPESAPGSGVGACHACHTRLSRHPLRANYPSQTRSHVGSGFVLTPHPCIISSTDPPLVDTGTTTYIEAFGRRCGMSCSRLGRIEWKLQCTNATYDSAGSYCAVAFLKRWCHLLDINCTRCVRLPISPSYSSLLDGPNTPPFRPSSSVHPPFTSSPLHSEFYPPFLSRLDACLQLFVFVLFPT
jgi:hypothetical protein